MRCSAGNYRRINSIFYFISTVATSLNAHSVVSRTYRAPNVAAAAIVANPSDSHFGRQCTTIATAVAVVGATLLPPTTPSLWPANLSRLRVYVCVCVCVCRPHSRVTLNCASRTAYPLPFCLGERTESAGALFLLVRITVFDGHIFHILVRLNKVADALKALLSLHSDLIKRQRELYRLPTDSNLHCQTLFSNFHYSYV